MTTLPFHTPSFDDAGETERLDHADHAIFRARARLHVEHAAYRRAQQPVEEAFDAVLVTLDGRLALAPGLRCRVEVL